VASGDPNLVCDILAEDPTLVNARDADGWTPLYWAAHTGNKDMVKLLLARGADANAATKMGWTPLLRAVSEDRKDVVGALLEKGDGVASRDANGMTPLHGPYASAERKSSSTSWPTRPTSTHAATRASRP